MKLAEALQERSDLTRRIEQLRERLSSNATMQEGEEPAECPNDLMEELERSLAQLEQRMVQINMTNSATMVEGKPLTYWIAKRDCLTTRQSILRDFAYQASQTARRATHSEIKILSTVNVRQLQKQIDAAAKELRLVDNRIQAANWATDLKEADC